MSCPVVGCSLAARFPVSPGDLIMNFTTRQHQFSVLITAAWRACLLVITDDGVPIDILTEPSGTAGIRMAILRAACVFIARTIDPSFVLVFNISTRELVG